MKGFITARLSGLRFHSAAWGVIFGTLISHTAYNMTLPFLAIYLGFSEGLSPSAIGLVIGVSTVFAMFAGFIGGSLSDRFGRLPVMLGTILVWMAVFAGFAVVHGLWWFLLLSALNGICRAFVEPISMALLADVAPQEKKLDAFNIRYAAVNIGAAIGPMLGVWLGSAQSATPFLYTAAVYGVYGAVIVWLLHVFGAELKQESGTKVTMRESLRVVAMDRAFRYFLLGGIIVNITASQMHSTLPQYFSNSPGIVNGVVIYSFLMTTNAVAVLALQYPLSRLAKRYHPLVPIRWGSVFYALGLFGFGLFTIPLLLFLSMVVFTMGEILVVLMTSMFIDMQAPENLRGAYFGANYLKAFGYSAGPWIGGLLLSWLGYDQGVAVFGILMLLTLTAIPLFYRGQYINMRGAAQVMKTGS